LPLVDDAIDIFGPDVVLAQKPDRLVFIGFTAIVVVSLSQVALFASANTDRSIFKFWRFAL
jgi:hypothetical protein